MCHWCNSETALTPSACKEIIRQFAETLQGERNTRWCWFPYFESILNCLPSQRHCLVCFFLLLQEQSLWIPTELTDIHSSRLDIDAIWCSPLMYLWGLFFFQVQYTLQFPCRKDDIMGFNAVIMLHLSAEASQTSSARANKKTVSVCVYQL